MKRYLYLLPVLLAFLSVETVEAKKVKYPNGDYYVGKWKKKTPHGLGTMTYANGDTYTGLWVYGAKTGEGRMTYNDGSIYEGAWDTNKYHGYGTMNYKDGSMYEGEWRYGDKQGRGKFISSLSDIYEGKWSKDSFHGQGKYTTSDGSVYEGSFYYGKKQGKGKEQTPQGWYEGEWKQDKFFTGNCSYVQPCGDKFEGAYEKWEIKRGKLTLANGDWYEGEWKQNKFYAGSCSYTSDNGDKYEGTYVKGTYGIGRLDLANGGWYHGTWKDGKFFQGDCNEKNEQRIYQGSYENSTPNTGTIEGYWAENFYKGEFSRGVFVNGECELKGNGYSFKGQISDGVYSGKMECRNGYCYEGMLNFDMQRDGEGILSCEDPKETLNATFEEDYVVKGNGSLFKESEEYTFSIENKNGVNEKCKVNVYNKGKLYLTEELAKICSDSVFYCIDVLIEQKVEKDRIEKEMEESRAFCKKHFMGHVYTANNVIWNSDAGLIMSMYADVSITIHFTSADEAEMKINIQHKDISSGNPYVDMQMRSLLEGFDDLSGPVEYKYVDDKLYIDGTECDISPNYKVINIDLGIWSATVRRTK